VTIVHDWRFIVGGTAPIKVMIRAIGPSLAAFGVTGVLPDSRFWNCMNKDGSLIYFNDNWRGDQPQQIIDSDYPPSRRT